MQIRLTGDFKLPVGVNMSPVIDWQHVQGGEVHGGRVQVIESPKLEFAVNVSTNLLL